MEADAGACANRQEQQLGAAAAAIAAIAVARSTSPPPHPCQPPPAPSATATGDDYARVGEVVPPEPGAGPFVVSVTHADGSACPKPSAKRGCRCAESCAVCGKRLANHLQQKLHSKVPQAMLQHPHGVRVHQKCQSAALASATKGQPMAQPTAPEQLPQPKGIMTRSHAQQAAPTPPTYGGMQTGFLLGSNKRERAGAESHFPSPSASMLLAGVAPPSLPPRKRGRISLASAQQEPHGNGCRSMDCDVRAAGEDDGACGECSHEGGSTEECPLYGSQGELQLLRIICGNSVVMFMVLAVIHGARVSVIGVLTPRR